MNQTVVVEADYSQFTITIGEFLGEERPWDEYRSGPFLTNMFDDHLIATTVRQFGSLAVEVHVHESRPEPLAPEWGDVSETSLARAASFAIGDWDPSGSSYDFDLDPTKDQRLRYGVAGADEADRASDEVTERYRIDVWPEHPSPAAVIAQTTLWGRYWVVARAVESFAASRGYRGAADDAEAERLIRVVFDRVPDLARQVRDGEVPWLGQIGSRFVVLGANHLPVAPAEAVEAFVRDVAGRYDGE